MTTNVTTPERKRKRYYRIVWAFYGVGIAGLLLGSLVGYELVGSVTYLLGIAGGALSSVYLQRRTETTLSDERDERLMERASMLTVLIVTAVGLAVFPVLFVLEDAGLYTMSPVVSGVLYLFGAIGILWALCFIAVKRGQ